MSRQLTLFGSLAKSKDFIIYKDPEEEYQCFIERFCLRARKRAGNNFVRKKAYEDAQTQWRNEFKNNPGKINNFLQLQKDERPFKR